MNRSLGIVGEGFIIRLIVVVSHKDVVMYTKFTCPLLFKWKSVKKGRHSRRTPGRGVVNTLKNKLPFELAKRLARGHPGKNPLATAYKQYDIAYTKYIDDLKNSTSGRKPVRTGSLEESVIKGR